MFLPYVLWLCLIQDEFFWSLLLVSIMSSANRDIFISSFAICMPFISYSCLIILARNSSIMSNNNAERGYPYLNPDIRRKTFSLSPVSMILDVGFLYMTSLRVRKFLSILVIWELFKNLEQMLNFLNVISASIDMIM